MTTNSNTHDPAALHGADVVGSDGKKLGKVDAVYLDDASSQPEWVAVKTGLFGNHVSMVPLETAQFDGERLTVPYDKDQLKDAPHHDPDGKLTPQDEQDLYRHYGVGGDREDRAAPYVEEDRDENRDENRSTAGRGRDSGQTHDTGEHTGRGRGHDASGPTTDDAMTRSEERLEVGTQRRESGRARLRKHVVTEEQQQTVPVSHEEVHVEREPITDENRDQAVSGGDITDEEHEVTLHEEVPVTRTETVPVERVRLTTDEVQGEEQVSGKVRKEVIDEPDTDTSDDARRGGKRSGKG